MGITSVCHLYELPKYLLLLLFFLDCILFSITMALFYVGLYPSDEAPRTPSWNDVFNLSATDLTASDKSLQIAASVVEQQLPVVQFRSFVKRSQGAMQSLVEEPMCVVCLGGLEQRDEVRELGNCCHAFHKRCIDQWVDVGRLTCPICRSNLLPSKRKKGSHFLLFLRAFVELQWLSQR